jgi:hypothetical protein
LHVIVPDDRGAYAAMSVDEHSPVVDPAVDHRAFFLLPAFLSSGAGNQSHCRRMTHANPGDPSGNASGIGADQPMPAIASRVATAEAELFRNGGNSVRSYPGSPTSCGPQPQVC